MKSKKIFKAIKSKAIKQLESEIKDYVVKNIMTNSKSEIKKLRKQILKEVMTEFFGPVKIEVEQTEIINLEKENSISTNSEETVEQDSSNKTGKIFEYKGIKFDVDRMSAIVTGKKTDKFTPRTKPSSPGIAVFDLPGADTSKDLVELFDDKKPLEHKESIENKNTLEDKLNEIKTGLNKDMYSKIVSKETPEDISIPKYVQGFNIKPSDVSLSSMNMVPSTRSFVKTEMEKITPAKKEEISFFIGKLKESVDSLGKGEKNIMYRKKKDEIYTFSFEKNKMAKEDFSFKFEFDLDMTTYGAIVNVFTFNIDGFNFDKGFVEILDIVQVLEASGINLMKYIDEINEINLNAFETKKKIKTNLENNVEEIKSNTELSKFIFDDRILKVLQSNDINTYGQLKKIEELTSLKGIGSKTAEKIIQYTKK